MAEVRDRERVRVLGQGSPEILAGIGKASQADVVRLLWPTGVVQDEVELEGEHAPRHHADRSPRQLVPGALLVERRALRVHRRRHRSGRGRALGRARTRATSPDVDE